MSRWAVLTASGLYVLFDPRTRRRWVADLAALAAAGVPWFQLRAKGATAAELRRWAPRIRAAIGDAVWLLNDDPEAARRAGADGVHVGPDDVTAAAARRIMGGHALIGISGDHRRRLAGAGAGAADYAGVGAWRTTATKADAGRALRTHGMARALRVWGGPAVAIGGVRPSDARALRALGVAAMAVYGGVWGAPDVVAAAQAYMRAWRAA